MFIEKSPKCNRNKTQSTTSSSSKESKVVENNSQECQLCYVKYDLPEDLYAMANCRHQACRICLESYLTIEITESRTDIGEKFSFIYVYKYIIIIFLNRIVLACPQCSEPMHPSDIQTLLKPHPNVISKYEGKRLAKTKSIFLANMVIYCAF